MTKKSFKIDVKTNTNEGISWEFIRLDHQTKGNYILATFYDRGAAQLFTEALESTGFVQTEDK